MRTFVSFSLLALICVGLALSLSHIEFGADRMQVGDYYLNHAVADTGASNIVAAVVVNYRALDTLGEVTVLFIASLGLGVFLSWPKNHGPHTGSRKELPPASLIVRRGSQFLFPLLMLLGGYIFLHGHLTPGGGFQGGAVIASAFLLMFLGNNDYRLSERSFAVTESLAGITFVVVGLIGLAVGGYFLNNFLPKGSVFALFSSGVIPILYTVIGLKVGAELTGIVANMFGGGGER
jgi:multicomponent Na+:H+ antiporter subunit B